MDNSKLFRLVLVLGLLAMVIHHACHSCSPPMHWKHQEVTKRATIADIVIVGKVVRSPYRTSRKRQASEPQAGLYDARFKVFCALKGGPLPSIIKVSGFGQVHGHCAHSHALENESYVGFLRKRNRRFFVAEINNQRGTIRLNQNLFRRIVGQLGVKDNDHSCLNIWQKRTKKPPVELEETLYRDQVKTRLTVINTERTYTAASLKDISNAGFKQSPGWVLQVLMAMYCLGFLPT